MKVHAALAHIPVSLENARRKQRLNSSINSFSQLKLLLDVLHRHSDIRRTSHRHSYSQRRGRPKARPLAFLGCHARFPHHRRTLYSASATCWVREWLTRTVVAQRFHPRAPTLRRQSTSRPGRPPQRSPHRTVARAAGAVIRACGSRASGKSFVPATGEGCPHARPGCRHASS